MQKADAALRQACGERCPRPGAEGSPGRYSAADCQTALCPGGTASTGCDGQRTGFEAWAPLCASECEPTGSTWKNYILKKTNKIHLSCVQPVHCGTLSLSVIRILLGDNLFNQACCDRARSNGFKLREDRFRLDIRKKFFTMRVVKPWNRLPKEVVDATSLETSRPGWTGL